MIECFAGEVVILDRLTRGHDRGVVHHGALQDRLVSLEIQLQEDFRPDELFLLFHLITVVIIFLKN